MIEDKKPRDEMLVLLGMIEAINFPIMWGGNGADNTAYYDLMECIKVRYESILKRTIGYES